MSEQIKPIGVAWEYWQENADCAPYWQFNMERHVWWPDGQQPEGVRNLRNIYDQSTVDALQAQIAELEQDGRDRNADYQVLANDYHVSQAQLAAATETWTDEHGEVWAVPTAWAYAMASKAIGKKAEVIDSLRAEVARLSRYRRLARDIEDFNRSRQS